ncbi:MAG: hypothetical protein QOH81_788, partial [Sphingomonadales bacterium]|nr:hypothetical protein [Sphingomonadales bacterium]
MNAERHPPKPGPQLRARLLLSSAAAAIVCVMSAPAPARAQAFQGNAAVSAGAATRIVTGPTSETIRVDSPSAILDWKPNDAAIGGPPIDFLPSGNIATFQNGPNNPSFMVLNRIVPVDPSRAIALNGTVISQIQSLVGTARGGTVAFYSPGGILIGGKAVIDVGNLLLTTIAPFVNGAGSFFIANTYGLNGAVDPKSKITIAAGARISALNPGSYIAMAAPVIEQHGIVKADGSIAYVAGEAVTLTINNGLFDIQVKTGSSSAANTLVHDGTTGGPASTGPGDNQRIYMVAVPKNAAITALLQGNVGFDAAAVAGVRNGEIVLSAGRAVTAADAFVAQPGQGASFRIQGGSFTSDVIGSAATDFIVDSVNADTGFSGNVSLQGDARAHVEAPAGRTVTVAGNLILRSDQDFSNSGGSFGAQGGEAAILTTGGTVRIDGTALLSAIGQGGFNTSGNLAGIGTGGVAEVKVTGGSVQIGGSLTADASGFAGNGAVPSANGAAGNGGTALVSAAGGTVTIGGTTSLKADGNASQIAGGVGVTGPTGTGGLVSIIGDVGGAVTATGFATLSSRGQGGSVLSGTSGTGGTGQGGFSAVAATGGSVKLSAGGNVDAGGKGGSGADGGSGKGGSASLDATDGSISIGAGLDVATDGQGGDSTIGQGGAGGNGTGGLSQILAHSGVGPSSITGTGATASARGSGGAGGAGASAVAGGGGGVGRGGTGRVFADAGNGKLVFGAVTVRTTGLGGSGGAGGGGNGGPGGPGIGGDVAAGTTTGSAAPSVQGSASFASIALDAEGHGGSGGNTAGAGTFGGDGGGALGGNASLFSAAARVAVTGAASLSSSAFGAGGGAGGTAGLQAPASAGTVRAGATLVDFSPT